MSARSYASTYDGFISADQALRFAWGDRRRPLAYYTWDVGADWSGSCLPIRQSYRVADLAHANPDLCFFGGEGERARQYREGRFHRHVFAPLHGCCYRCLGLRGFEGIRWNGSEIRAVATHAYFVCRSDRTMAELGLQGGGPGEALGTSDLSRLRFPPFGGLHGRDGCETIRVSEFPYLPVVTDCHDGHRLFPRLLYSGAHIRRGVSVRVTVSEIGGQSQNKARLDIPLPTPSRNGTLPQLRRGAPAIGCQRSTLRWGWWGCLCLFAGKAE